MRSRIMAAYSAVPPASCSARAGVARCHHGAHVGVAGIEQQLEVGVIHVVVQAYHLARLVEPEAGLEFPHQGNAVAGGSAGRRAQALHRVGEPLVVFGRVQFHRWARRIHAQGADAGIGAELQVGAQHRDELLGTRGGGRRCRQFGKAAVDRVTGHAEPLVGQAGHQVLALGAGVVLIRVRVRRLGVDFHAVVAVGGGKVHKAVPRPGIRLERAE